MDSWCLAPVAETGKAVVGELDYPCRGKNEGQKKKKSPCPGLAEKPSRGHDHSKPQEEDGGNSI